MSSLLNPFIFGDAAPIDEMGTEYGFLNVLDETGVYNDGTTVCTGLETALIKAKDANQTAYFPEGTYLVDDRLYCVHQTTHVSCGGSHDGQNAFVLVGSKAGARPIIKLKDNSTNFQNAGSPLEILRLRWNINNGTETQDCCFGWGISNIDFDCGSGNAGAVGVHFNGAQDCFIQDVKVTATGAYAGFTSIPGRNSPTQNIEVVDGKYALKLQTGTSLGSNIFGFKASGQTDEVISAHAWRGVVIVGFEFTTDTGPFVTTDGNDAQEGNLVFIDGTMELTTAGTAIDNSIDQRAVILRNVYFKNATTIMDSNNHTVSGSSTDWRRATVVSYTPTSFSNNADHCENVINGVVNTNHGGTIDNPGTPPSNFVSRHVWGGSPEYKHPSVVNAVDEGITPRDEFSTTEGTDHTIAIQALLDANDYVFFPAGIYDVSGTITLNASNHVFGVMGRRTIFRATDTWSAAASVGTFVVDTVSNVNATTTLEHIVLDWKAYSAGRDIAAVKWQVGRNSVLRSVRVERVAGRYEDSAKHIFEVFGNGGGRWFGYVEHMSISTPAIPSHNVDFRKLYVDSTSEPFSLYGCNLEHGGTPDRVIHDAFFEIVDSSNVRMFGSKQESKGNTIEIQSSDNIYMAAVFCNPNDSGYDLIKVTTTGSLSADVEIDLALWPSGVATDMIIREVGYTPNDNVSRLDLLGKYSRGTLDWTAWD